MATERRTEPQRWSERQRSRLLQNQVRQKRQLESASKRRKGSFLVRMGSTKGPLKDEKGRPTRLKLSLIEWGHRGDKASAVAKGRRLLARYKKMKERKKRKA